MTKAVSLVLALLLLCAAPAWGARGLAPQDILVVVNADAKGSEALGKYYCLARGVLTEQLLVLHCDTAAICSRAEYDRNIAGPIRQFILEHDLKDRIKCILLMWGVPVRVLGTEMTDEQKQAQATWKLQANRLSGRLSGDAELLKSVLVAHPTPKANTLNIADLFETKPRLSDEPPNGSAAIAEFNDLLKKKQAELAGTGDETQKQIARRQLAALRLDFNGLNTFVADWPKEDPLVDVTQADLRTKVQTLQKRLDELPLCGETPEIIREKAQICEALNGAAAAWNMCIARANGMDTTDEDASVDSELSLIWQEPYNLHGPLPNALNWRIQGANTKPADMPREPMVMCCRLDGVGPADALRMIKDSIWTEQNGLTGKLYIDAGGKYPIYDEKVMKPFYEIIKSQTKITAVYDSSPELFAPGSCPDAALYVGWYSLQHYIPSLTLNRGAVGWHVASLEAMHLRTPSCNEWCPKLIQNGIAATLGAVNEPFLYAFPTPAEFYSLLLTGDYTVAECYWRTIPWTSWRMTLIADPLYNPYRLHPELSTHRLPAVLAGQEKLEAIDR